MERIANVIREEAEHVNSLVADLLYLGEIDAGHVLTHEEDVPLETLVARCVRRIEPTVHAKNIDVRVDVAPDATLVRIDPDKLERALTNVLDNATKFTPDGGDVEVRGWRENGTLARARLLLGPQLRRVDPGRRPAAALRPLLPRRPRAAFVERQRARAGDLAPARRAEPRRRSPPATTATATCSSRWCCRA